jgi:hypothetical protein
MNEFVELVKKYLKEKMEKNNITVEDVERLMQIALILSQIKKSVGG